MMIFLKVIIIYTLFSYQMISAKHVELSYDKGFHPIPRYGIEYKTSFYSAPKFTIGINALFLEIHKDAKNMYYKEYRGNKPYVLEKEGIGMGYGLFLKYNFSNTAYFDVHSSINYNNEVYLFNRNSIGLSYYFLNHIGMFVREDYDVKFRSDLDNHFSTSIGLSVKTNLESKKNKIWATLGLLTPLIGVGIGAIVVIIGLSNLSMDCTDC